LKIPTFHTKRWDSADLSDIFVGLLEIIKN